MTLPVVLDLNGTVRDWAWLRAKYGNVSYLEADGYPKFQLSKVEEMEGPQTMMVSLQDENGAPHSGQPVVLSWPSLAQPSRISRSFRRDRSLATPPAASFSGPRTAVRVSAWAVAAISVIRPWAGRTAFSCFRLRRSPTV